MSSTNARQLLAPQETIVKLPVRYKTGRMQRNATLWKQLKQHAEDCSDAAVSQSCEICRIGSHSLEEAA
jgi:hypothetical protein